jgi:uncharacterized protein YfaS (alpha-2-macroglobulin family)
MDPRKNAHLQRFLSLAILFVMLLSSCQVPPTPPAPTAGPPTAARPTQVAPASRPAATPESTAAPRPTGTVPPTAIPPTPAPTTSPTPVNLADLPLPAPRLVYFSPSWGEEQLLDAPIVLTFDQPMDHASTEGALTISPTVTGTFSWSDDHTVVFAPQEALVRGKGYRVELAATARNSAGEVLAEGAYFDFNTVGFLQVSEVQPSAGASELDPNTVLTVVFNRPVVPLTYISNLETLPQPLKIIPAVRGKGEWLNTSIYVFHPEQGFLPSTRYTATVAAGLEDTLGGLLPADYTWTFSTFKPAVRSYTPASGATCIYLGQVISVTFNQPMDHLSVQEHFSLTVGGQPVEGRFRWSGGQTPTAPETMGFVPQEPLARASRYTAAISAGSRPRAGTMLLDRRASWVFTTIGNPGLVNITHRDDPTIRITYGSPMKHKGFLDYMTITPTVPITDVYVYWDDCGNVAEIYFPTEPATTYTFSVSAAAPEYYGVPVGTPASARFATGNLDPYAYLNTSGLTGAFNAYTDTAVYAAYRNVAYLELTMYRISPEDYMLLLGYGNTYIHDYRPKSENLLKHWTTKVTSPANKDGLVHIALTGVDGERLAPGLYLLKLTAPGVRDPSFFLFSRSRINLTLKQAPHQTLVWATDLATGRPVPNLAVRLYTSSVAAAGSGTTDAEGLFRTDTIGTDNLHYRFFAVAGQPGQDDFSLAFDDWNGGIQAYDFNLSTEYSPKGNRGYLYTERPIYRPGQTVYFKGILRYDDDAHYSLPTEKNVTVLIQDPQGKEVYKQSLALNDMGTVNGELVLAGEAALGTYYVYMGSEWDYNAYTFFRVAEYKKPEFQVQVQPERTDYAAGEAIDVTAGASYYFGGPVADAAVHWSVLSEDYYFSYDCPQGRKCPWYSWSDYDPWYSSWDDWSAYEEESRNPYGRLIAEGDTRMDSQGLVSFTVSADVSHERQSQLLTIEASVTDISGQQVSNRTAAIVHKGQFYIGVAPRGYLVETGKEKEVDLLAVDWDSQPVANARLTIVLLEHRWYSVRQEEDDGGYYWHWTVQETPVYTTTTNTNANGEAVVTLTPPSGGTYRVRASGRDARGNEIHSSAYFWVWGGRDSYWRQESNNRIELVADKREYEVGDTAEILIPSPYTGTVYALITIERGHILETSVRQLKGTSDVLWIPLTEDHVPNIYVSVVLIQGAAYAADGLATFRMGMINLPVSNKVKELHVTLTPDKDMAQGQHYGPRQTATYDVFVTDAAGKPVEAEFSLRLADLAVLALASEVAPPLLEHYWYARGVSVRTSMPLVVAMEPYNREIKPGAKGGGGKGTPEEGFIRTRFADTAYWAPAVRTGTDGHAQVQVELPDNLTTWRMQAIGITADTRVGRTDVDVLTTLDVLVRSVLPRFFVVGDKARIGTIVHNNSNGPLDVRVELEVAGLELEGPTAVTVTIPANDMARVNWPVTVPGVEQVQVTMTARAGSYLDGRTDILPVYRYSTPEVVATAGRLSEAGARLELVQLPPVLDRTQGDLSVQVNGSLTAATKDALTYLEHYPYECVEQTTSRFLPNVFTYQVLKEMGLSNPELEQNLTRLVGVALQRLYSFQHYDGGWGWWLDDLSNPYLTAYVLQGMLEARRAGFTVDENVMRRGAAYLRSSLTPGSELQKYWQANRLAYGIYVLAEYHSVLETNLRSSLLSPAVGLFEKRHLLSRYGQATLAVAFSLIEPEEPSHWQTLLSDLTGDAIMSATGTHWEEDRPDYWNMNTDIRSTAIVIWALSRLEPKSELLPNAVRWLMAVRKEGYWRTTNATAWSLMSLVAYMRASGEMEGDYSYTVYLNGEVLGEGDVNKANLGESHEMRVEIAKLLVEETNRLIIERHPAQEGQTGQGQLYYTAYLRYFLPVEMVKALNRGIVVGRQYTLVNGDGTPVTSAGVGDLVRVKLTIVAPNDLYYVVVEDPLPAGCEGVDTSLLTTSVVGERPRLENVTAEEQDRWYRRYGWGWWWFSHTEMRDEKVVLFATYLPRGTYEYTYMMRPAVPGEFLVMPSVAYQMYFPEVFGRSDGGKFEVRGGE